jgi:hypothetical protein
MQTDQLYAHRRNEDESYNSICRACFATVVRHKPESELAEHEKAHECDSSFLAERGQLTHPVTLTHRVFDIRRAVATDRGTVGHPEETGRLNCSK